MMKLLLLMISLNFMLIYKYNFYKYYIHNYITIIILQFLINLNKNNFYWTKIYYVLGMDHLSEILMILSIWILSLSIMASNSLLNKKYSKKFMLYILMMLMILIMCFSSMNLFMFYILFEFSLIPMILIIMGWGLQIERIQASVYMLFYTLTGSLPTLMMLFYMMNKINTLSMVNLTLMNNMNYSLTNIFIYFMIISGFLVKMPLYLTHSWLPKAHVEAPISGSMILAGIMLKLGTYGIYRMILIFPHLNMKYNFIIIPLSLMGSIYSSLICMNQTDMKIIVAYSSVVHMNFGLSALLTSNQWGMTGNIMMMIAHGLCSSGMFCLVNINYERLHTRMMILNKGFINISPPLSMWWFLICSSNFSAPPSLNLMSEICIIKSLMTWSNLTMGIIFFIIFYSTYYSIYLYASTQHGPINPSFKFYMIYPREFLLLMMHWIPLNLMFLMLNMF